MLRGDGAEQPGWPVMVDPNPVAPVVTRFRSTMAPTIVIAAGARPFVPPIPGIEKTGFLTSDTLWSLRELPARLVVLGAEVW